jgi:hypothetical protein
MDLLITPDEIENLPENPQERFVQIEKICRNRYYEHINREEEWNIVQYVRLQYMTLVVPAATYLKIDPISEIEMPRRGNLNDHVFADFVSDLNFYMMQLMLEGADRKLRTAIYLEGPTRERLRTLTSHLRNEVRKLNLPPARIDKLIRQIDQFDQSLESRKLTFVVVGVVALTLAGAIADVDGATTAVRELVNKIEETVGQAKEEQDKDAVDRKIETDEVLKLSPPRTREPALPASNPTDLDDEIPF